MFYFSHWQISRKLAVETTMEICTLCDWYVDFKFSKFKNIWIDQEVYSWIFDHFPLNLEINSALQCYLFCQEELSLSVWHRTLQKWFSEMSQTTFSLALWACNGATSAVTMMLVNVNINFDRIVNKYEFSACSK